MRGLTAVTRAVGPALANCELTFVDREPIDLVKASEQHSAYCTALREAGISVIVLPPDDSLPDAVFVEDAALVLDELAVVTRPGAHSRRMETEAVAAALAAHRRTARIEAPGTLEGGDVLRVGRQLFVGMSSRSNDAGFKQLAAIVTPLGYEATQLRVHGCLHLKTAVTAVSQDTLLINPRWIDADKLSGFRLIVVPNHEPFAANTLSLGGVVHMSSKWNHTRSILEEQGFKTRALSISEFEKAEAGLTCLSLIFLVGAVPP